MNGPLAAAFVLSASAMALAAAATQPTTQPFLKTKFGDVRILPADNPWNTDISKARIHPQSADFIASIGLDKPLHPDFGAVWNGAPSGIPYVIVGPDQPKVRVKFQYADESDKGVPPGGAGDGPAGQAGGDVGWYPIPSDAPIEGGPKSDGDRHILVIDAANKLLYETFATYPLPGGGWKAGSGAIFDLTSNRRRPAGWTSADAAGLPIFPGLVRYDEAVERGEIRHAIRFTCRRTQRGYIAPATHFASASRDPKLPPMGLRVRLRADFDDRNAPKSCRAILKAMKTYGLMLADNGGDWFISGAPDPRWNDEELQWLRRVKGRDFEAVFTGEITRG